MGLGVEIGRAGLKIRDREQFQKDSRILKKAEGKRRNNLKHPLHGAGSDKMVSYIKQKEQASPGW